MLGTTGIPAAGEREMGRSFGEGVGIGDAVSEYSSASERGPLFGRVAARDAKAAAVAAAASSTVPV